MKNFLLLIFLAFASLGLQAQTYDAPHFMGFQPTAKKTVEIKHMQLEVQPFVKERTLYGKTYLTMKPYFRDIDNVQLDARGFNIKQVYILKKQAGFLPLEYDYDNKVIDITVENFKPSPVSMKQKKLIFMKPN